MRVRTASGSAVAIAAGLLVGCGGSGEGGKTGDTGRGKSGAGGPTIQQAVQVSKKNPGLKKCRKVSYGVLDNTPETPNEPQLILAITCDGATVGVWERYKTESARAAGKSSSEDRPYLVNGPIKVTTGEAIFAHIDAEAWKTMPAELKAACGCGELRQPKS